jgi:hypothetical protein
MRNTMDSNPNNVTAQVAVKNFANDLAARFSPIVGCTRSWNSTNPNDFLVNTGFGLNKSHLMIYLGDH